MVPLNGKRIFVRFRPRACKCSQPTLRSPFDTLLRDAIALNIGSDSWQQERVATAYQVARDIGATIKLFLSFDFAEMGCPSSATIANRVNEFKDHPNQFRYNGKVFISTFEGRCLGDGGWADVKARTNGYLMPFISGLENNFQHWPALDSWFWWVLPQELDLRGLI